VIDPTGPISSFKDLAFPARRLDSHFVLPAAPFVASVAVDGACDF
jgi:hypothetical protein